MTDISDRGGKPQIISCTQCGERATNHVVWGLGWAYLCATCMTQYVRHIMEGLVEASVSIRSRIP